MSSFVTFEPTVFVHAYTGEKRYGFLAFNADSTNVAYPWWEKEELENELEFFEEIVRHARYDNNGQLLDLLDEALHIRTKRHFVIEPDETVRVGITDYPISTLRAIYDKVQKERLV